MRTAPLVHQPRSLHYSRPHDAAASTTNAVLIGALFLALVGNIPPAGGFSMDSDGSTAVVRAAGFGAGSLLLLFDLIRNGSEGARKTIFFLTPFLAFLAFCMLSASWSLDPKATIVRSTESMGTFIFCGLWTHAAVRSSDSDRQVCSWIAVAIVGVAVYGLLMNTALFGNPIRMVTSNEESDRIRLVFGGLHPLAVGDIMSLGIVTAVMSSLRVWQKIAALFLFSPLLILTDATGARVLVAIVLLIYITVQATRFLGLPRLMLLSVPFGIVAVLGVALLFSLEHPVAETMSGDERIWTLTGRTTLWAVIWESGLANTWLGTGFDAARSAILDIFGIAYQVHNQYLSILVELGYVGLFLFVPMFIVWGATVFGSRSLIAWCFAIYIAGINMDNASMLTKTWLIFATVFCYIISLEQRQRRAATDRFRRASSRISPLAQR